VRWFEIDPTWQMIRVLGWLRIIDLSQAQKSRWEPAKRAPRAVAAPLALPSPSPMDGE